MADEISRSYSIEDLRRLARRRLPRAVFDFFDGGAEDESTLRDNRLAFGRLKFMPKSPVNVSTIDASTALLGSRSDLPMAIAPTGAIGFGWPRGDIEIAKAAAAFGIPFSLSTSSTASIEAIAREAPGRLWFQAYVFRDKAFLNTLIERARAADYEALIITVDMPVGGKRERDFRNDFDLPFRYTPRNVLDFAHSPRWGLRMLRHGMPVLENLIDFVPDTKSVSGIASSVGKNYDDAFSWDFIQSIRDRWPRKLIIKGILRAADAQRVAAIGCDGLVVSNHGGRQLDGALASLDALPAIVNAVAGRVSVLLDSGVRRGADIIKARALGAEGVLIGRPALYGVAAGGEKGARRALEILSDELVRTMRLCGVSSVDDITADVLAPRVGFEHDAPS
ncbi:alpha-hydroxy-acid oxidizing protein [Alcaligenaceae bacterium]|nr:alpha-hydroxy-acid oxidizing protein [Alcaligenaceae bacterium]